MYISHLPRTLEFTWNTGASCHSPLRPLIFHHSLYTAGHPMCFHNSLWTSVSVSLGWLSLGTLIETETSTWHRQRAWGSIAVWMFVKAKGSLGGGGRYLCKQRKSSGIYGDRMQVKYVRSPREHIFISITEKKIGLGSYPALSPSFLGCED